MRAWPLIILLSACTVPPEPAPGPPRPDLELTRVTINSWSDGGASLITTADSLQLFREGAQAGEFVARDAGLTVVRDGLRFTTPEVRGNLRSGQLWSDAGVHVQVRGFQLDARGFTADTKAQTATFEQPVSRFSQ